MATEIKIPSTNLKLDEIPGDKITWRHMERNSGGKFNKGSGNRYFAIKLDEAFANELEEEGWNIIWRNVAADNEPELIKPYLKVFIKYGTPYPVDIYLINDKNHTKTALEESDLDNLAIDHKKLEYITVVLRPYHWTFDGDEGIKAQVQAMNIKLAQNGLDDDYEIVYPASIGMA